MKFLIFFLLSAFFVLFTNAQTPQAISYQAVARNSVGQIIPSQNIGVRFSILDGSVTGTTVYQETHATSTNNFGLFTLAIGRGTVVSGTLGSVNWSTGDKFLKVEIAPQGGTNYLIQGTTQLLSVPYALYSEKTKLLSGNNTITIANGNTITGNYQPANNTILINGNTIGGNYQAANNTVLVNGNTIAGNYQAGAGIGISANTISHNLIGGTGINITGNTISATGSGSSQWTNDASGINYQLGGVGIGMTSEATQRLSITAPNGMAGLLRLRSADTWQSALIFGNTSIDPLTNTVTFSLGGSANTAQKPGNFGIYNNRFPSGGWLMNFNNSNNFVAFGNDAETATVPRSRIHVISGDVNIEQIGSGIILKSPNGQCWRVTIDNAGNLIRTSITCP